MHLLWLASFCSWWLQYLCRWYHSIVEYLTANNYRHCCVWKMQKDRLIPKQSDNSCLHNIALYIVTRIHSSGPPRSEQEKRMQSLKDKNILLFDPAVGISYVTHVVTRPTSVMISNRVQILRHLHQSRQTYVQQARIHYYGNNPLNGSLSINYDYNTYYFIQNYSTENQCSTTKRVCCCICWGPGGDVALWIVWPGSYVCC